jgi:hypothetical protein
VEWRSAIIFALSGYARWSKINEKADLCIVLVVNQALIGSDI